jgi:WD40 repeat protein
VGVTDRETKHEFFSQLGLALRERNRWALFIMREDYLAALDPYTRPIPTRLTNTYRLDFLGVEAARQAIHRPAKQVGVNYTSGAVNKLINDLRLVQVQQPDGSMDIVPGPYVEPVQLQVVCTNLWRHLPNDKLEITEDDITAVGNVDQSLAEYYAERVANIAPEAGVREREIREWCDHHLITESGLRGQVLMGQAESEDLSNKAIRLLEDTHLIRAEKRLGATWFELSHDRLIQPVRQNNAIWFQEHLSLLQRQASLWLQQNRSDTLYLRDHALEEAEQWANEHPEKLSEVDREFLDDCLEIRARERAAQEAIERERQLKLEAAEQLAQAEKRRAEEQAQAASRLRRRAYILAAVLLLAVALAVLAYINQVAARNNARAADQQRQTAQAASTLANDNALRAESNAAAAQAASTLAYDNALRAADNAATAQAASTAAIAQQATAEYNAQVANEQKEIANLQASLARSRELASLGVSFLKQNSVLTLLLSKEAMDISDTGQALDSLLRGLQRNLSRRSEKYDQFIPNQEIAIYTVATSPDGRQIVWGGSDGLIRAWDLNTREVAWSNFMNQGVTVRAIVFSPDGKSFYAGDERGNIAVYDSQTGRKIKNLPSNLSQVYSLAISPDGSTMAIGGKSTGAEPNVWTRNLDSGNSMNSYRILRGGVEDTLAVAWSPDGKLLASGGRDRAVHIWDPQTHQEIATLNFAVGEEGTTNFYEGPIRSLAFSPNGKWLATGGEDNQGGIRDKTLLVWDTSAWSDQPPIYLSGGPDQNLTALLFSPDGQTLVSGYGNGEVATWNFNSQQVNETFKPHSQSVTGLGFSQFEDSLLLSSVSPDRSISLTNLIAMSSLNTPLVEGKGNPSRLAFGESGLLRVAGTSQTGITLWDIDPDTGQGDPIELGITPNNGEFYLSPDGGHLAFVSEGDQIEIRDETTGDTFFVPLPSMEISTVTGQGVASSSEEIGSMDFLAFSNDGSTLAGAYCNTRSRTSEPGSNAVSDVCTNRQILVWNISTGEVIQTISSQQAGPIRSMAFAPDDRNTLAVGYQDASIQFWNLAEGSKKGLPLIGLGGPVTSLAFHFDGDVLASGSENKLIALWNLRPPQLIGDPFTGSDGSVTGLAFSRDNSELHSATANGTIWRWNFQDWKQLACELAERNMSLAEWEQFFPAETYRPTCEQYPLETPAATDTPTPTATATPTPTP